MQESPRLLMKTLCTRRTFLITGGAACGAVIAADRISAGNPSPEPYPAAHWSPGKNNTVVCSLCPWQCNVEPGARGRCGVRENRGGKYYSLVYGRPCTINNDPIEKKPFFHVYPGTKSLSLATVGCNISCRFCQNWEISQTSPDRVKPEYRSPEWIAAAAAEYKATTIAFTYSEPTIFFEYMIDCAKAARERNIGSVVVSNGFIAERPLKELCKIVDAVKIDLKSYTESFYEDVCSGRLQPVLDTLKRLSLSGVWHEIVYLVIPTLNDNIDDIKRMSSWIIRELGDKVPLHFTRFRPMYKLLNLQETPPDTLKSARQSAMSEGCRFVYTGNMPKGEGDTTYCPDCKAPLVSRYGFHVSSNSLVRGKCSKCGVAIPGLWTHPSSQTTAKPEHRPLFPPAPDKSQIHQEQEPAKP